MATHREIQKALLDMFNRGEKTGHFLEREIRKHDKDLGKTYFFSWATVSGEIDFTHEAKDARRLWIWQFHLAARVEHCKTSVAVACPERYRLRANGQKVARYSVELSILPGDEFAERFDCEIVDDLETFDLRARYEFEGQATIGKSVSPLSGAVDLV
jgi:hypothetical protein